MPRYLIERRFPPGLEMPVDDCGWMFLGDVLSHNAEQGVTWMHSYVDSASTTTYCIYEASSPEAIRCAAERNGLPVHRITEVNVLDPHSYRPYHFSTNLVSVP
jgi:hypothetical protein